MKHLQKISQFLYFYVGITFGYVLYMYIAYPSQQPEISIFILLSILLIPIFDKVCSNILGENNVTHSRAGIAVGIAALIAVYIVLLLMGVLSLLLGLAVSLIFVRYFRIDGRLYFVLALLLFFYVGLSLAIGSAALGENISIIAYYMLIAGVVSQILENISFPKTSTHA